MAARMDKLAWRTVLDRFETPLLRYAIRITGDRQCAEEVVQEVFMRWWEMGTRLVGDSPAPWLFRVCRNLALDRIRKEKRMEGDFDVELVEADEGVDRIGSLEANERARQLREVLAALPESHREVLILKYYEDLSYKEISSVTGLSVSHVGVLLHDALARIKKMIASQETLREQVRGGVR